MSVRVGGRWFCVAHDHEGEAPCARCGPTMRDGAAAEAAFAIRAPVSAYTEGTMTPRGLDRSVTDGLAAAIMRVAREPCLCAGPGYPCDRCDRCVARRAIADAERSVAACCPWASLATVEAHGRSCAGVRFGCGPCSQPVTPTTIAEFEELAYRCDACARLAAHDAQVRRCRTRLAAAGSFVAGDA